MKIEDQKKQIDDFLNSHTPEELKEKWDKYYYKSEPEKTFSLYNVMLMFFKPSIFWDWLDFGLVLKVYKQNNIGRYHFAIDIQIAWFNLWLQCWKKNTQR